MTPNMDNFSRSVLETFVASTLGSVLTQTTMKSVTGSFSSIDWTSTMLSGVKVGNSYIAHPVACEVLKRHCTIFRESLDDPVQYKLPLYVASGAATAAYLTAANYPLSVIEKSWNTNQTRCGNITVAGSMAFFAESLPSSIGFSVLMGTLPSIIPQGKSQVGQWGSGLFVVSMASVGAGLCSMPMKAVRKQLSLPGMIGDCIHSVPGVLASSRGKIQARTIFGFMTK